MRTETLHTMPGQIRLNRMPAPTWNRLKLNDITVQVPVFGDGPEITPDVPAGLSLHSYENICTDETVTALGSEFCNMTGGGIMISGSSPETARLGLTCTDKSAGTVFLRADKGAEMTVMMYVAASGTAALRTFAEVPDNAHVRLVQVFEGSESSLLLSDVGAVISDSARLDLTQIFLGGACTASGVYARLDGFRSEFGCKTGYILSGTEKLDINDIILHTGRRSRSATDVKGVLSDSSEKLFRGTIDFRNGAAGSVGSETEDVLLMSENVVNKTVPVILCSEEDVEGSHGASIGRIADDVLYYMTSRGIPLEEAYRLMAASRIESLINGIGDEPTVKRALDALARRGGYAVL